MSSAEKATMNDRALLEGLHPLSAKMLRFLSSKDVVRIPGVGTVVSEPSLIRHVLMTRAEYSKTGKGVSSALWNPIIGDTGLLNMDGDPHLTLKRSLSRLFVAENIKKFVEPELAVSVSDMGATLMEGGEYDVVRGVSESAYGALLAFAGYSDGVIGEGRSLEVIDDLRSATHGVNLARKKLKPKQILEARRKLQFIDEITEKAYLAGVDALPEDTVIRTMMEDGYSLEGITSLMKSLMIAGTETVISFIPRMVALLVDSGRLKTLTKSEMPAAVEEALRVTTPTPVAARLCVKDAMLGDVPVKAGERMILSSLGASQRLGAFDTSFSTVNREIKGLWFGAGVHMCIGLPIAMLEAETFLAALVESSNAGKIQIVEREAARKGHTGSYSKLLISYAGK